ncbi:MAG: CHC2 zinc finger domain-containing protein [Acidimicrobiales bacterium]
MAIPDEDVAAVRSATDVLALIGEYTPLKRVGRRYVGLCPFHAEKTGSFSVNAEEGLYYCFGCQASGDAITFLRTIEGCDFVEAVERLAARSGIAIRHENAGKQGQDREGRQALLEVMERAVAFYHEEMLSRPDAKRARQYLRSRGYEGATVRQFRLGWAPDTGRALVGAVRAQRDLLVKAGLAHEGQHGLRDAFRGPSTA